LKTEKIALGRFLRPFGVKGEIKFQPYFPKLLDLSAVTSGVVRHAPENGRPEFEFLMASARPLNGGIWAVRPDRCDSPESARQFTNAELFVSRSIFPKPPEGEFLPFDVIDCDLYDAKGPRLGVVRSVIKTGANDVWEVLADDGKEIMIPAIKDVVASVEPGKITINVLDGLLD
jgi:16S rRNA processing protein RimM